MVSLFGDIVVPVIEERNWKGELLGTYYIIRGTYIFYETYDIRWIRSGHFWGSSGLGDFSD
jgi:hypothetical protein